MSCISPQGHSDANHVLPHVVFADPHLPWEVIGSPRDDVLVGDGATQPRTSTPPRLHRIRAAPPTATRRRTAIHTRQENPSRHSPALRSALLRRRDYLVYHHARPPTEPIDATGEAGIIFLSPRSSRPSSPPTPPSPPRPLAASAAFPPMLYGPHTLQVPRART